jgi:uncharacterized protein (TIGR03083 family)
MRNEQYLDAIARESAAMADAAERAGLDASVPSCPGWTVHDLVEHMGNVQRWAATIVATHATERISRRDLSESPPPAELVPWFRTASATLVETLAAADPAVPVWTFLPERTVGFWFRRQAHEVAVHRVDTDLAAGDPRPIGTELAADGIAEWVDFATVFGADALRGDGETVHLHCTDTAEGAPGEWLVTLTADGPTVEPVHAKGDVAARGPASDLVLHLWGRVGADTLEVFGDTALLERVVAAGRI